MFLTRFLGSSALALTVVLAAAGCAGSAGSDGETDDGADSASTGTWRDGTAWLTLDDGRVTGSDGCNGVNGSYTAEGDTVTFELGMTTMKACVGVTITFSTLTSATVADDELTLRSAGDVVITTLKRDIG
jgi:hypothetical protein